MALEVTIIISQYGIKIRCKNSNNLEKDELKPNNEDIDYKDLITRLKEIKSNIALLEKVIFK